jgi:hypothetical protein
MLDTAQDQYSRIPNEADGQTTKEKSSCADEAGEGARACDIVQIGIV